MEPSKVGHAYMTSWKL